MPSLARTKYYVYTLSLDNLGKYVFYVGKGSGSRPNVHGIEARSNALNLKCSVIRFLWRNKQTYSVHIKYETDDEMLAYWHEMKAITSYPPGSLTNIITGHRKPPYELKIVDHGHAFEGYLIDTGTGEEMSYISAVFRDTVVRNAALAYDGIVLPPYFDRIGYKPLPYFKRKPGM